MTQAIDLGQLSNQAGASVRARLNVSFQAIASRHYGSTAPSPSYPNMEWFDSSTGKIWTRDPTNSSWNQTGTIGPPIELWSKGAVITANLVGEIKDFSFSAAQLPSGWIQCDGRLLSRATYSALAAKYATDGYPYGAGDGSTTFNVPDLRGRARYGTGQGLTGYNGGTGTNRLLGAKFGTETHILTIQQLPQHTVPLGRSNQSTYGGSGAGDKLYDGDITPNRFSPTIGAGQQMPLMSPGIAVVTAVWTNVTT